MNDHHANRIRFWIALLALLAGMIGHVIRAKRKARKKKM
jgi:hypothetical protein